jgi:hypothetical protein
MISGISGAAGAVRIASARYDRAAQAVVDAANDLASNDGSDATELAPAIVQMATERLALLAALEVARSTNETLAELVEQRYDAAR